MPLDNVGNETTDRCSITIDLHFIRAHSQLLPKFSYLSNGEAFTKHVVFMHAFGGWDLTF